MIKLIVVVKRKRSDVADAIPRILADPARAEGAFHSGVREVHPSLRPGAYTRGGLLCREEQVI